MFAVPLARRGGQDGKRSTVQVIEQHRRPRAVRCADRISSARSFRAGHHIQRDWPILVFMKTRRPFTVTVDGLRGSSNAATGLEVTRVGHAVGRGPAGSSISGHSFQGRTRDTTLKELRHGRPAAREYAILLAGGRR